MTPQRVRELIGALEAEVNNGGFDQWLFNSAADDAAATIRALDVIGAATTAATVRRVCGKFPGGMPPEDRFARQDILLSAVSPSSDAFEGEDAEFYRYADDLEGLVGRYAAEAEPGSVLSSGDS